MKNLKAHLILLSIMLTAAFAFQNCGKVRFSSDPASLVEKNGEGVTPGTVPGGLPEEEDPIIEDPVVDGDSAALIHICILAGPGKSRHIGYSNGLFDDKDTPQSVCMSQRACLEIAAAAFDVKSAEVRGFCPNKNPHVVPMTDQEVADGVAAILSAAP